MLRRGSVQQGFVKVCERQCFIETTIDAFMFDSSCLQQLFVCIVPYLFFSDVAMLPMFSMFSPTDRSAWIDGCPHAHTQQMHCIFARFWSILPIEHRSAGVRLGAPHTHAIKNHSEGSQYRQILPHKLDRPTRL